MRVPRALADEWEARLRAEGLGRIEERRQTEAAHIERRYKRESADYWALAADFAARSDSWHRLSGIDAAVWRMHVAGLPRWAIALVVIDRTL